MNTDAREPVAVCGKNRFTEQEYLEIERRGNERHEFWWPTGYEWCSEEPQ